MEDVDNNVTANGKRQSEHASTKVRFYLAPAAYSDSRLICRVSYLPEARN